MNRIVLVPIGDVDESLLEQVRGPVEKIAKAEVVVAGRVEPPPAAFDGRRQQFAGDSILDALERVDVPEAEAVIGLLEGDAWSHGLSFIFGQADVGGREAFVALARLHESFYGNPENGDLLIERTVKEILHELGHTRGKSHCPDPRCVMHFSNTIAETDRKGPEFCEACG